MSNAWASDLTSKEELMLSYLPCTDNQRLTGEMFILKLLLGIYVGNGCLIFQANKLLHCNLFVNFLLFMWPYTKVGEPPEAFQQLISETNLMFFLLSSADISNRYWDFASFQTFNNVWDCGCKVRPGPWRIDIIVLRAKEACFFRHYFNWFLRMRLYICIMQRAPVWFSVV